jgi:hypothetical protein
VTGCTVVKSVDQYFSSVNCLSSMWRLGLETGMVSDCAMTWELRSWVYIGIFSFHQNSFQLRVSQPVEIVWVFDVL